MYILIDGPNADLENPVAVDSQAESSMETDWPSPDKSPNCFDPYLPMLDTQIVRGDVGTVREYELEGFQLETGIPHWKGYLKYNHYPFTHCQIWDRAGFPPLFTRYIYKVNSLLRLHVLSSSFPLTKYVWNSDVNDTYLLIQHLGRAQALFLYLFIRPFDSDKGQRAYSEELSVPLQECKNDQQTTRPHGASQHVRRIWMVVNYIHSVYLVLRDGQAMCPNIRDPFSYILMRQTHCLLRLRWRKSTSSGRPIISIMWDSHRTDSMLQGLRILISAKWSLLLNDLIHAAHYLPDRLCPLRTA
ncbi:hypothetical protein F5Y12DRAFT_795340 [Xylaria sp. FL1777]|nr:hypothetical protein F5Y12DRAFT_795340 [Xylaria sp. FL1777]